MKYLLTDNTTGKGAWVELPFPCTRHDYVKLEDKFRLAAKAHPLSWISFIHWDHTERVLDVPYTWRLAGPDGASFELIQMPDTTAAQIKAAKAELRRTQDVVSFSVIRVRKIIPL